MTPFKIYQKWCYANHLRLDHARDAWRLDRTGRRRSELRRRLDGHPDVVPVGAPSTAAPGRKTTASAGLSARLRALAASRRQRSLGRPPGRGGGAVRRPASAVRRVRRHSDAPNAD